MPNTLGEFLTDMLRMRQLSNRALATRAGVSEGVIRNLLQHGTDLGARDPDPRTLRTVADALGIDSLKLFHLAGYITLPPNAVTPHAEFLAEVFDRLPADKQNAVMRMLAAFTDQLSDSTAIQAMLKDTHSSQTGLSAESTRLLRLAANHLIKLTGAVQSADLDVPNAINADWSLGLGQNWSTLSLDIKYRILELARAKLDLEYQTHLKTQTPHRELTTEPSKSAQP